jgi:hypothetical protein
MSVLIDPVVSMQFCRRMRVERGGASSCGWRGGTDGASRDAEPPEARFYAVGFRICLSRSCNVSAD